MDEKTKAVLNRISQNVPDHLKSNLTKTVIDTSEEEVARRALAADFISLAKKKKIKKILDAGGFRRAENVINEEVVKEIDQYYDQEIKKAIAAGQIPDPKDDPFIQERRKRQEDIAQQRLLKHIGGQALPQQVLSTLQQKKDGLNSK